MAKTAKQASGPANEAWETIKSVGSVLLIVLVLRVFLFQPFTIPSASMEPALYEGDYIYVSKYTYGWSRHSIPFSPPLFDGRIMGKAPQRGDVVVFKTPRDNRTDLIKRVIGMPGDRLQMRDGLLYINGVALPRQAVPPAGRIGYGNDLRFTETLPNGKQVQTQDFGPDGPLDDTDTFVVPEGHYFMMGDNRDNSVDSRVPPEAGGAGFVPAENLEGKAEFVLLSWKPGSSLFKPWTWLNLRGDRFFHRLD
ncbi:signal peptidase I [Phenylobacterium deserti]|uniref:Signal peptidase I n=1 Tax=Phenylobacterium deserti TaxID=1914756 RepID=A0A328AC58_9CAUL|nr:signal peptidase I [Phenylobacterium deserti]RAK50944.1 signal peptidase I [Phenylobacterium deserti]